MKRTLFGFTAAALLAGSATATILASDDFNYDDGSLVGNGGWTTHSGTTLQMQVSGGAVIVNEDGSQSEDANIVFAASSGIIYYGIDFTVGDLGSPYTADETPDYEYFAHFKVDGANDFSARLDIVPGQSGGDFSVGIASDESTADAIWGTDLTYDTIYRAIVAYNQDTNQAQLWIDASSSSDISILGEDRADPGDAVTSFALRQSNSDGDEIITVDNLIVATTFAEVVPEPTSLALLGLGGLLFARRRRG